MDPKVRQLEWRGESDETGLALKGGRGKMELAYWVITLAMGVAALFGLFAVVAS
jgi:hypothetical protein